jgi:hypothetical protein
MAKKKTTAPELSTSQTLDGYDVTELQNVTINQVDYITGFIGTYQFFWFIDGKRNSIGDDAKDLIF